MVCVTELDDNYQEVDEEMSEDHLKAATTEDKSRSDLNLKKKSSNLTRSHSCRKADSGSRFVRLFITHVSQSSFLQVKTKPSE